MTVRSEVEAKLAAFAAAQSPPIKLAYENVSFVKPTSGNWLQVFFIGESTQNRELSAQRYTNYGMFQVSVYGKIGEGMGKVETLARAVQALFPVVPKEGLTSVEQTPSIGPKTVVDDFVSIPVTVRYRAEF